MVPARSMKTMRCLLHAGATLAVLAVLAVLALAGCADKGPVAPPAPTAEELAWAADLSQWRAARVADLTRADGWTALVGLHWLDLQAHYIGSGSTSGIRLGYGPERLGLLKRDGRQWRFSPEAGAQVLHEGTPVSGAMAFNSDRQASPTRLAFDEGKGVLQLIERGGRFALRVRHADAPTRVAFSGLTYWAGGLDWRVPATFVPHPAGRTLQVVDILGMASELPNPGQLQFQRDGLTYALEAIDNGDGRWMLIFADRTSGHGSYPAGRYLDVDAPAAHATTVMLDFNRAYNPPCAFTPYATCPLPPAGNRLDLRIEAGEKVYVPTAGKKESEA